MEDPGLMNVDQIYTDFLGRRAGLIQALTVDYNTFSQQCEDGAIEGHRDQCLYGDPKKHWELNNNLYPNKEQEQELPEPTKCLGNVRAGVNMMVTATGVANHSDAWLLNLVNYFCNKIHVAETDRQVLLNRIAQLPRISEVVARFDFRFAT